MTKNKIRLYREKLGYTQSVLAEKTNLSLRTIQRVESGDTIPKGYTLIVLSQVLGIDKFELNRWKTIEEHAKSEDERIIRLINLSTLSFIGIPFGNILIPMILWRKKRNSFLVDEIGRRIINFQIIWTIGICIALIVSPFLQKAIGISFPLILYVALVALIINILVIGKTAISLNKNNYDILNFQLRFF